MDNSDALTVDSWGGATHVTTMTSQLVPVADGSENDDGDLFTCPRHPHKKFRSRTALCSECEREFQDNRLALKEKRQQLQEMMDHADDRDHNLRGTGDQHSHTGNTNNAGSNGETASDILNELQVSMKQWNPAAAVAAAAAAVDDAAANRSQSTNSPPPGPPLPAPTMSMPPIYSNANSSVAPPPILTPASSMVGPPGPPPAGGANSHLHENNNSMQQMQQQQQQHPVHPGSNSMSSSSSPPRPPAVPAGMPPSLSGMPGFASAPGMSPNFHGMPLSGSTGSGTPPAMMDALTIQLQRMQQMQDWMLWQKEMECQQLRQKVDEYSNTIHTLKVDNALLQEKLHQQEQRMQHELKLIKLAALQQRSSRTNSNGHINEMNNNRVVVSPSPSEFQDPLAPAAPARNNQNNLALPAPPLQQGKEQPLAITDGSGEQNADDNRSFSSLQQQQQQQQQQLTVREEQQHGALDDPAWSVPAANAVSGSNRESPHKALPPSTSYGSSGVNQSNTTNAANTTNTTMKSGSGHSGAGPFPTAAAAPSATRSIDGSLDTATDSEEGKDAFDSTSITWPTGSNHSSSARQRQVGAAAARSYKHKAGPLTAASVQQARAQQQGQHRGEPMQVPEPSLAPPTHKGEQETAHSSDDREEREDSADAEQKEIKLFGSDNSASQTVSPKKPSTQMWKNDSQQHKNDRFLEMIEDSYDMVSLDKDVPQNIDLNGDAPPTVPLTEAVTFGTAMGDGANHHAAPGTDGFVPNGNTAHNVAPDQELGKQPNDNISGAKENENEDGLPPKYPNTEAMNPPTTVEANTGSNNIISGSGRGVSFVDDNASMGQTVASSTYGEDRQRVVNSTILDPYGDKGQYTGVILRSTGMPHGSGRMLYQEDKRTYDGEWRHGRWHGFGRATFANGDHYKGEYRFDQRHGRGRYEWNDGRVYDGMFREDKRHGHGTFTWPDGAVYEGEFKNGQREGHGMYKFSDGGRYEGSWKNGRYSGYGVCSWQDGRCYKGEWLNGMAHGKGVETFADGSVRHDGQWLEDEPL